jgi:glycosyltransferase involved in cell wall biosynthesis/predicted Zn-dependent protease
MTAGMALRLIDTPQPDRRAGGSVSATSAVGRLVPTATARLNAGDWAGYKATFADAAAIEDVHRRYEARRALLAAGLRAAAKPAALIATAAAALDILIEEPREPVVLNAAGVAFYELGALQAAEELFTAARRLDPELPHVDRNLAECKRRRRKGIRTLPQAAAAVRGLQPKLDRVTGGAEPAKGMTLSLCMIVKDEEAMLGRCLEAVRGAVDEIVVVDTGSTDRTVEIAESFGARVLHHAWDGDFSAARNASFAAATGDWVMYLDADEVLVADDVDRLRALTGRTWREGFYLVETNHTGDLEDGTAVTHDALRVFRNRPEYRFEGRIHEQIAHRLPTFLLERLERTTVRVEHYGYLGAVRGAKDKLNRNLELLERQLAEGNDTPFLHFNLGSEYLSVDAADRALPHFARAWKAIVGDERISRFGFAPALGARYVKSLRMVGRLDEVGPAGDEVLAAFPGFTDVVLEQALAAASAGDLDRAEELLRQCLEMGDGPSRYSAAVGCGTYRALVPLAEVLRRRGAIDEAEATLRASLEEHPGFLGAVEPFASALLRRGVPAAEAVAEVHALVADVTPGVRFLLAVALSETGAPVEAETELRALIAAQPGNAHARVALAETLLAQGRFADAAAAAGEVDPQAACAGAAQRTELFARLVEGPDADAAAATALPETERAVFAAWAAARSGAAVATALPAAAALPVLTMLDALARLEAFDAFAALVAVLERVGVPELDRRQALAELYLRHGYVDLAGEEWLAICDSYGADARSLRGLAAVAAARGMDEDARVFEAEAAQLAA